MSQPYPADRKSIIDSIMAFESGNKKTSCYLTVEKENYREKLKVVLPKKFLGRCWMKIKSFFGCGSLRRVMQFIERNRDIFEQIKNDQQLMNNDRFRANIELLRTKIRRYQINHSCWITVNFWWKIYNKILILPDKGPPNPPPIDNDGGRPPNIPNIPNGGPGFPRLPNADPTTQQRDNHRVIKLPMLQRNAAGEITDYNINVYEPSRAGTNNNPLLGPNQPANGNQNNINRGFEPLRPPGQNPVNGNQDNINPLRPFGQNPVNANNNPTGIQNPANPPVFDRFRPFGLNQPANTNVNNQPRQGQGGMFSPSNPYMAHLNPKPNDAQNANNPNTNVNNQPRQVQGGMFSPSNPYMAHLYPKPNDAQNANNPPRNTAGLDNNLNPPANVGQNPPVNLGQNPPANVNLNDPLNRNNINRNDLAGQGQVRNEEPQRAPDISRAFELVEADGIKLYMLDENFVERRFLPTPAAVFLKAAHFAIYKKTPLENTGITSPDEFSKWMKEPIPGFETNGPYDGDNLSPSLIDDWIETEHPHPQSDFVKRSFDSLNYATEPDAIKNFITKFWNNAHLASAVIVFKGKSYGIRKIKSTNNNQINHHVQLYNNQTLTTFKDPNDLIDNLKDVIRRPAEPHMISVMMFNDLRNNYNLSADERLPEPVNIPLRINGGPLVPNNAQGANPAVPPLAQNNGQPAAPLAQNNPPRPPGFIALDINGNPLPIANYRDVFRPQNNNRPIAAPMDDDDDDDEEPNAQPNRAPVAANNAQGAVPAFPPVAQNNRQPAVPLALNNPPLRGIRATDGNGNVRIIANYRDLFQVPQNNNRPLAPVDDGADDDEPVAANNQGAVPDAPPLNLPNNNPPPAANNVRNNVQGERPLGLNNNPPLAANNVQPNVGPVGNKRFQPMIPVKVSPYTPTELKVIEEELDCEICNEIAEGEDPVIGSDLHTYIRSEIEDWLSRNPTSPMTRDPMTKDNLIPNKVLGLIIKGYKTEDISKHLLCPISNKRMTNPVIGPDGNSYEREEIEKRLRDNPTSPKTNEPMRADQLRENLPLKNIIDIVNKIDAKKDAIIKAVEEGLRCAISNEIVKKPVIGTDLFSYERPNIEAALLKEPRSPKTRIIMTKDNLITNRALETLSECYKTGDISAPLFCPITGDRMVHPVIGSDGHSYEREAIVQWLSVHMTSPLFGTPMYVHELRENRPLKNIIARVNLIETTHEAVFKKLLEDKG